jgi:hypothetical protein
MENPGYLREQLEVIREDYEPIVIDVGSGFINRIYYRDSTILTRLIYYPFVQLALIVMFIMVSYIALSSSRKADQNKLWVAMSKETAHQLGTPTSSSRDGLRSFRADTPTSQSPGSLNSM